MNQKYYSDVVPTWSPDTVPDREAVSVRLHCPFEGFLNRSRATIAEASGLWALQYFGESRSTRGMMAVSLQDFTGGFYPDAEPVQLRWATDYLYWAFFLDDLGDETDLGCETARLAELFNRFDAILCGERPRSAEPHDNALADLMERLVLFASPAQFNAFREANRAYFGAMLWEANNRSIGWVPDEETFKLLRPVAGAVPPFFALIEPVCGFQLSERLAQHPSLVQLQRLAGRIVCWYNDLLSYEKERAQGDVHNLAIVYEKRRRLESSEAFSEAIEFCNDEVEQFASLWREFSAEEGDSELHRYVGILESMMVATLTWTMQSARYAEVRREAAGGLVA